MRKAQWAAVAALALIVASCGGGDGAEADDVGGNVFDGVGQASGDVEPAESGSGGGVAIGPVTQTAEPSTGWVEIEGDRYEFAAVGSVNYQCEVLEDSITVNFQQTTSGNDMTLQGRVLDGQLNASLTFAPGEDNQVTYGATIGFDPGTLGLGMGELSYEGTMSRVEDYDITNAEDVQGTLAVNCADPGSGTSAEVGGESFMFPFNGATSLDCTVGENEAEVLIGHSQPEFTQLQVDIRDEGGDVFGAVTLTAGEGTYSSFIPADGTGLTVEGSGLTYQGVFTTPGGEETEGSITVSCG